MPLFQTFDSHFDFIILFSYLLFPFVFCLTISRMAMILTARNDSSYPILAVAGLAVLNYCDSFIASPYRFQTRSSTEQQ